MRSGRGVGPALAAIGLALVLAAPAEAARHALKHELSPTGADPNASGRAKLVLRTDSNGKFDLIVHHLDRDATFQVLVGGVNVGGLHTNHGGNGRATFRSRPRPSDALLGFDPRGETVTVRNVDGQDVLSGDLPDGGTGAEVPCCLSHDGHVRCDGRSAESCAAAGGTAAMASSCLPDPCGGTPTPDGTVCCVPEDSAEGSLLRDESGDDDGEDDSAEGAHVHCTDNLDQATCSARGGSVVQATSCHPNPCAPTPPPVNVAPCCVPDDDETECEMFTAERCAARGGTSPGGTSCAEHPCGDSGHHHHGHGD